MERKRFDHRKYVGIDQGLPENKKVIGLSNAAFRLYIECICYCARQETDGEIPAAAMRKLGSPRSVKDLHSSGLLEAAGQDWMVHDYLMHQRSADEIAQLREAKSENGIKGTHIRWHVGRRKFDPNCKLCTGEELDSESA